MKNQNGIVVFVTNLKECTRFYKELLGLPQIMEKPGIVRFQFGSMYLQIEDLRYTKTGPTTGIIIRQNVSSISKVQNELIGKGLMLEVHDLEWGKIAFVLDPQGNKVEFLREK